MVSKGMVSKRKYWISKKIKVSQYLVIFKGILHFWATSIFLYAQIYSFHEFFIFEGVDMFYLKL